MRKAAEYIILPVLALSLLAGCGSADKNHTEIPAATQSPMMPTPDVDNGIVKDNDGVITGDDNGTLGNKGNGSAFTASPKAPSASPTAAPSQSPANGKK